MEELAGTDPARAVEAIDMGGSAVHSMSAWGLFMQADIVVKLVMLLLVVASVWCWAIIFEKSRNLKVLNRRARKFEEAFWSGESLDKLYERVKQAKSDPMIRTFIAGMEEWRLGMQSAAGRGASLQAGLEQRIERAMMLTMGREMDKIEKNMTFLANVGSSAPFIGLFGTVWGVMNSFTSIAASKNTSLVVVAPGIAEALFATALGLFAAIPAVIAYNKFSADINRYADRVDAFTNEFSAILSRHLSQQNYGQTGLPNQSNDMSAPNVKSHTL
jgi:biopolymer transport protein TolQ